MIRTSCGLRQRLVATWAEFQHSVVHYVTDQCRKRLEACINAEGGHSERKCADTTGTVLVPRVDRFQCKNINIFQIKYINGSNFIEQHSETVMV